MSLLWNFCKKMLVLLLQGNKEDHVVVECKPFIFLLHCLTFTVHLQLISDDFISYICICIIVFLQMVFLTLNRLRVVPLFETVKDLRAAGSVIRKLLSIDWYRDHIIKNHNGHQEVYQYISSGPFICSLS